MMLDVLYNVYSMFIAEAVYIVSAIVIILVD